MHRCLYGIVHPDDHDNMKSVLERHGTASVQQVCLFLAFISIVDFNTDL